jgi:hypothetical protein
VKSYSHLGHIININLLDNDDILIVDACVLLVKSVMSYATSENLIHSLNINCLIYTVQVFFCCELWSLSNESINGFATAWRKGCRRVWDLPSNVHCFFSYC